MPAKPSGEIKTSIIKTPQKNGDIYIIERKTKYDPDKKYTQVISSKLISKRFRNTCSHTFQTEKK